MTGMLYFQRDRVGNWFGDYWRTSFDGAEQVGSSNSQLRSASNDDYPLHDAHLAKCYMFIRESMICLAEVEDVLSMVEDESRRTEAIKGLYDLLDECDGDPRALNTVIKRLPLREAAFLKGLQSIVAIGAQPSRMWK